MNEHEYPLRKGFRLEEWIIQPQLNRILNNGQTIQVQPKIMDVLVCLAESRGEVVLKKELFQIVWEDTNVTEHALSRAISELRKIFKDKPNTPRVIETIPKKGYRLIPKVTFETPEPITVFANPSAFNTPTENTGLLSRIPLNVFLLMGFIFFLLLLLLVLSNSTHGFKHGHF